MCVSVTSVARAVSILASDTLQPLRWVCNIAAQNFKRGKKRLGGTDRPIAAQEPRDSAEQEHRKTAELLPRKSLPSRQDGPPTVAAKENEEWTRQAMIMNGFKWWDMFGIGPQKASHLHIRIALSILCVADAYLFMTC